MLTGRREYSELCSAPLRHPQHGGPWAAAAAAQSLELTMSRAGRVHQEMCSAIPVLPALPKMVQAQPGEFLCAASHVVLDGVRLPVRTALEGNIDRLRRALMCAMADTALPYFDTCCHLFTNAPNCVRRVAEVRPLRLLWVVHCIPRCSTVRHAYVVSS